MKLLFLVLAMALSSPAACAPPGHGSVTDNFSDQDVIDFISCVSKSDEKSLRKCRIDKSKINSLGRDDTTALSWLLARENISPRAMVEVIKMGADPHAGASTPAGYAISVLPIEYLKALVEMGLDVNDVEKMGEDRGWDDSFLFSAILSRDSKKVKYLISKGANLEVRNSSGNTPILFASGNDEIQIMLLEAGADPHAKNSRTGEGICWAIDELPFQGSIEEYEPSVRKQAALNIANRRQFIAMLREHGIHCRTGG
jgi:ankyrin repeat protein